MKIAVLMSGGIDSSFAALYLKEKGYKVIGISFLPLGKKEHKNDLVQIERIAKILSIPYFIFDIKDIFEKEVIKPFCQAFSQGETPNPCPFCNKKIKFGLLWNKAKKLGAEKIASGHYARIRKENNRYQLLKAKDKGKDQSYFLWTLSQRQLSKIIFPLGNFKKDEIVTRIKNSPLSKLFSEKKEEIYSESQDICFLKGKKISEFLKYRIKVKPGIIFTETGEEMGRHPGICFFTIGQRTGLGIGARSPHQKPFYVIEIDKRRNAIIVGDEKDLYKKKVLIKNVNWISEKEPKLPLLVKAKIRYRHQPNSAVIREKISKTPSVYYLEFKKPQRAITPGQHIVFYQNNLLLGGGIIDKTIN